MVCSTKWIAGAAARSGTPRKRSRRCTLHSILGFLVAQASRPASQAMSKTTLFALAFAVVAAAQSAHLSDFKQLTHGGQNAEAYWSPDGKRLIFQTTRPPYDGDQIFVMNADGSNQHVVSTGKG